MLCFIFLSLSGETLLSSLHVARCLYSPGAASKSPQLMSGSQTSLGSLTGAHALPRRLQTMSSSPHQHGVQDGERQRWPSSSQAQGRRCQPMSPGAALAGWAGWGCWRRQAAPSPQAGEEAAGNNLTSKAERGHQPQRTLLALRNRASRPCSAYATSASPGLGVGGYCT